MMPEHKTGTREEWQAARELAQLEAKQTRRNEEIYRASLRGGRLRGRLARGVGRAPRAR